MRTSAVSKQLDILEERLYSVAQMLEAIKLGMKVSVGFRAETGPVDFMLKTLRDIEIGLNNAANELRTK